MLVSIVILILTLGGECYAAPFDETTKGDEMTGHYSNLSAIITGDPIDGGKIPTISIPQLEAFDLILKDGSLTYDIPEGGIDIPEELYEKLSGKKPK